MNLPTKRKRKAKTKEMLIAELEEAMVIQVTAYEENRPIGSWDFFGSSITIGRSRSADLRLPTETISRLHAVLERTPEGVLRIKDSGSRNGLYLNGRRIEAAVLTDTDKIRIGAFTLRCQIRKQGEVSSLSARITTSAASDPSPSAAAPSRAKKKAIARIDLRAAVVEKHAFA